MDNEAQPERPAEPLLPVGEDVNLRLTSQAVEIKRLTETLSRYMDRGGSDQLLVSTSTDVLGTLCSSIPLGVMMTS